MQYADEDSNVFGDYHSLGVKGFQNEWLLCEVGFYGKAAAAAALRSDV